MHADCLPNAAVTVRVNGTPLTEHATENDHLSATTFVEAVAGAEFDVALTWNDNFAYRVPTDRIRCSVYIDGQWVQTPIVSTQFPFYQRIVEGPQQTINGVTTLKRLTFAQHASTDNVSDDKTIKKLSDVGQIKVILQRCRIEGPKPVGDWKNDFKGVDGHAVSEKALKGRSISNHTKLGRTENRATPDYVNVTYPYGEDPIATYVFQYRTRRDLEIEGIIERAPSPVPLIDRDPDELTAEELREQVRLLRARQPVVEIKKEIKREKRARQRSATLSNNDDDEGDVTIMSENNKRQRTRASMENAEVIDLSD